MIPMSVPAKLLAMSSMALCSLFMAVITLFDYWRQTDPEYIKPLQPTARVRSTMAAVGWSPVKEAPRRARAGPMVAIVLAIFLMTVVGRSLLSIMVSTVMDPAMETSHMAR